VSQRLHPNETPLQESIIPPPPSQSSTYTLPAIIEGAEHLAFRDIPEQHLHQPINTSTIAGAPLQSFPWAPLPIHMPPGDEEPEHVQINDLDNEAKEEEEEADEEELARVHHVIERLQQEQESILRRQDTMQRAKAHRKNINR
jgi:hypothetical protein